MATQTVDARPFSLPLFFLTIVVSLAGSLIARSGTLRWIFWLAVICGNTYLAFTTTGHAVGDYYLGAVCAGSAFIATDYVLFTNPHRELKLVGQKGAIADASLWERFKWGMKRWSSIRSIGWTDEPKVFRERLPSDVTRRVFVVRRLLSTVIDILLLDAWSIYNRLNPAFHAQGISTAARPMVWRYFDLAVWACTAQVHLRLLHGIVSMISVALGVTTPQEWVHPFGYWRDAYTLRRFWGRTWHQVPRRCMATPGKHLARNVLHLTPGSFASSWTQLCTSFALSTFMHLVADFTMFKAWNVGGAFPLFPLQAVAVMIEDVVLAAAKKLGHNGQPGILERIIGYAWVWTWFVYTFPGFVELGFNLPVSFILGVWKGEWNQA
ncbi:hypothetical protein BDZ89DRAFT_1058102 [Hymenopellis radicata]|nr:hypothetical protein BDZ89DRAFT_1058102 [Hymenopellis radicata]